MLLLLVFLFTLTCSAQKLIDLKSFRGGNVTNPIDNPAPYAIFVSANSDSTDLLSQVWLVKDDGSTASMRDLIGRKMFEFSGQLIPTPVEKSAYVTSNLTDDQMNTLTGFMFVSTSKQLQSNNFYVIDVDKSQHLSWTGLGTVNTDVLFLNSYLNTNPWHSSTISLWSQPASAENYIYTGFPTDSVEKNNSQIFSNPFLTSGVSAYIKNVEKFSLSLPTFYIKSFMGLEFTIEPNYYEADQSSTTAYTTTGLYMKPINVPDKTVTIYTIRDENFKNGTVGANVVGSFPDEGRLTVSEHDGLSFVSATVHPVDQILGWSSHSDALWEGIGKDFQITSTDGRAGEYYVQYYVIADSNSSPSFSTSRPIITTTKSSGALKILITLLIPLFRNMS